jgi:uncharacterized protein
MSKFEWDKKKQQANLKKHSIDFIDAQLIFNDPNRIEVESERNGEKRYITIGEINDVVLFVVYINRGKCKRIISARRASKYERKTYENSK